jgi:hypothetical protein
MNTYQVFSINNTLISAHDNPAIALKHALIYQHATGQPAYVEQVPAQAIGAWCDIEWLDNGAIGFKYASFGEYDEENDADNYGIDDEAIFYYCDGEADIKRLMGDNGKREFRVLSYELEYKD